MLMRNGKASVDKLSNSCFSFITQHSSSSIGISITSLISCENEPLQTKLKYRIVFSTRGLKKLEQKVDLISEKKFLLLLPLLLYSSQLVRFLSCWAILWSFQALHFKELLGCVKEGKIVKGEQKQKHSSSHSIWTKHWKMAPRHIHLLFYSVKPQTAKIGHLEAKTTQFSCQNVEAVLCLV